MPCLRKSWRAVRTNPFEALFALLAITIGLLHLLGIAKAGSVAGLPTSFQLLWASTLAIGGALTLVSMTLLRNARLEAAGLVLLGTVLAVYGSIVLIRNGLPAIVSFSTLTMFGTACFLRASILQGEVRRLRSLTENGRR